MGRHVRTLDRCPARGSRREKSDNRRCGAVALARHPSGEPDRPRRRDTLNAVSIAIAYVLKHFVKTGSPVGGTARREQIFVSASGFKSWFGRVGEVFPIEDDVAHAERPPIGIHPDPQRETRTGREPAIGRAIHLGWSQLSAAGVVS
jgi:hypothetical protein